jgi:hypothetical protein
MAGWATPLPTRANHPYIPSMPGKPTPQPDDPAQYQRFLDMAKEVGADESPDGLDEAFDRLKPAIVKPRPMKEIPVRRRKK